MPLQLPNLDDRSYNDLIAEAMVLIPTYSPEWTNHNPSDPGVTLIELFAYLTDMLLYRLNRVTDDNKRKFVRLLNGPDWVEPPNMDLREEIRQAVLKVRERYRAVTREDYEFLSTESFNQWLKSSGASVAPVARAHCVPQRNLDAGTEADRLKLKAEHVSVVIVPANPGSSTPQPGDDQIGALFGFLDERRMLTTKLHVTGPFYAHIHAELVVARRPDVPDENALRKDISNALIDLLNPLPSATGKGWPFGRDVFVSDIYSLLEQVPGIDFVTDIMLDSDCSLGDPKCVVAEPIWHDEGDQVGLRIQEHHLPVYEPKPDDKGVPQDIIIVSNSSFVVVNLYVPPPAGPDVPGLKRKVKAAIRNMFHPGLGGPGPTTAAATDIPLAAIKATVKNALGTDPGNISVITVPAAALQTDKIHIEPGMVLDWHVQFGPPPGV